MIQNTFVAVVVKGRRRRSGLNTNFTWWVQAAGHTQPHLTLTRAEKGLNKSIHRRKWGKLIRDQREQVQNIQNIIVTTLQ